MTLKDALIHLLRWIPELTKPSDFICVTGLPEDFAKQSDGAPFFNESFLYVMMGKDDARTLLAKLWIVCEAAGFDMFELECEANRLNNEAERRLREE